MAMACGACVCGRCKFAIDCAITFKSSCKGCGGKGIYECKQPAFKIYKIFIEEKK